MNFKKVLLTILFFSLTLITPHIIVSAQERQPLISLKDTTNPALSPPSFPSILLNSQEIYKPLSMNFPQQLIIVQTSDNYNQQKSFNMIQRISNIDSKTLYALYNKNIHIKFINFPITYLSEYSYLSEQVPRGWEGTGYTWDYVPGIGGNPVVARIGYSDYGNMHTSINLEIHETAHAIDRYVFQNISYSQEFLQIHNREYNSFSNSSYYYYYSEEYFAEAYDYYYLNSSTHEIF